MIADEPLDKIINLIGHDGSEKIWPDASEPYCYRGFEYQEITRAAYKLGFSPVMFYVCYAIGNTSACQPSLPPKVNHEAISFITPRTRALLMLSNHAVATDGVQIYDPKGYVMQFEPIWVEQRCDSFLLFDNIIIKR